MVLLENSRKKWEKKKKNKKNRSTNYNYATGKDNGFDSMTLVAVMMGGDDDDAQLDLGVYAEAAVTDSNGECWTFTGIFFDPFLFRGGRSSFQSGSLIAGRASRRRIRESAGVTATLCPLFFH